MQWEPAGGLLTWPWGREVVKEGVPEEMNFKLKSASVNWPEVEGWRGVRKERTARKSPERAGRKGTWGAHGKLAAPSLGVKLLGGGRRARPERKVIYRGLAYEMWLSLGSLHS